MNNGARWLFLRTGFCPASGERFGIRGDGRVARHGRDGDLVRRNLLRSRSDPASSTGEGSFPVPISGVFCITLGPPAVYDFPCNMGVRDKTLGLAREGGRIQRELMDLR